jgi:adenylate kinase family enzyme
MKNKIIIISGFPATGKSTFSQELSRRLRIPCFNKDIIREQMAEGFGVENAELMNRNKMGSTATTFLMRYIAENFMKVGTACILESNFSVLYPQPLTECGHLALLAEKYRYDALTYAFTGDYAVLGQRYINRDSERHWVHERAADASAVKDYCARARLDEINIGQTVKVDTTSFEDVDFERLYAIAGEFVKE